MMANSRFADHRCIGVKSPLTALLFSALCLSLPGCTLGERVVDGAIDYNIAVERATNAEMLLNVIRAKNNSPRIYTRLTQVTGSLGSSVGTTSSLASTITQGPNNNTLAYGFGASATLSSSPSFVVANLDSQEFRQGIMRQVPSEIIANYWNQGWPKVILAHLFLRRVDIMLPGEKSCYIENYPMNREKFEIFSSMISEFSKRDPVLVTKQGQPKKIGPAVPLGVAGPGAIPGMVAAVAGKLSVANNVPGAIQLEAAAPESFTFNFPDDSGGDTTRQGQISAQVSMKEAVTEKDHIPGRQCERSEAKAILEEKGEKIRVDIKVYVRSPDSMIYYLGQLVRAQYDIEDPYTPKVIVSEREGPVPLFRVLRGRAGAVTVDYDAETYSIPGAEDPDESGRSLQVLTLVEEIFSLSISAKDLPKSDTIRIAN